MLLLVLLPISAGRCSQAMHIHLALLGLLTQLGSVLAKQEPAGHFVWHRRVKFGAHDKVVAGNEWTGKVPQHKQVASDAVAREVAGETPSHDHINAEPQRLHGESEKALLHHFSKRSSRAPAPGPAPGPAPAPWSEDPQWMVDGARGDKTQTVPITNQFKGLESIAVPEQGFHGRPVRHSNGDTMVDDFTNEFGRGHMDAFEICMKKEHRSDYWCRTHLEGLMGGSDAGEDYAKAQGLRGGAVPSSLSKFVCALAGLVSALMACA